MRAQIPTLDESLHGQLSYIVLDVPTIPDIVLAGYPHIRFRTHTALGSYGIISDNQDLFPNPPGEAKR